MPKNLRGRDVAVIVPDKCVGCQVCMGDCPVDAIKMEGNVAHIDLEACIGCGRCLDVCPVGAVQFEKPQKKVGALRPAVAPPEHYRGVAVFIEARNSGAEVSWQLVGKARELAARLGEPVLGFIVGSGLEAVAREALEYGCDSIYLVDSPALQSFSAATHSRALAHLCDAARPSMLLLGATPDSHDVASFAYTLLEAGLTADCTALDVDPRDRLLLMTRPTFGGNVMATIVCRTARPQMCTVRPNVFATPPRGVAHAGDIVHVEFEPPEREMSRLLEFIPRPIEEAGADITKAHLLVVIGKGACRVEHLPMFHELAGLLGGAVACSRPVVEAGLLPYLRQVGQTGRTVAPRVYIGIAVSGAVQHLVGMQASEKIVAINTDRNAPLVQMADFALIGDYIDIVPSLIDGLKARPASGGQVMEPR